MGPPAGEGFGAMDVTKPYKSIGFGDIHGFGGPQRAKAWAMDVTLGAPSRRRLSALPPQTKSSRKQSTSKLGRLRLARCLSQMRDIRLTVTAAPSRKEKLCLDRKQGQGPEIHDLCLSSPRFEAKRIGFASPNPRSRSQDVPNKSQKPSRSEPNSIFKQNGFVSTVVSGL